MRQAWTELGSNKNVLSDIASGQGHTARSTCLAMSRLGTAKGGPAVKDAGPSHTRNPAAADLFTPAPYANIYNSKQRNENGEQRADAAKAD